MLSRQPGLVQRARKHQLAARVGPSAPGSGGGSVVGPTDEEKGSGYGATFVAVSIIITAFLTVLAVVVVGKLYYGTVPIFGGGGSAGVGGGGGGGGGGGRRGGRRGRGRGQMHHLPEMEDDDLVDHPIDGGYRDEVDLEDTDTI